MLGLSDTFFALSGGFLLASDGRTCCVVCCLEHENLLVLQAGFSGEGIVCDNKEELQTNSYCRTAFNKRRMQDYILYTM